MTIAITDGLAAGAKLREQRMFTLSPYGVEFLGGRDGTTAMTLGQWHSGLRMLRMVKTSSELWMADFVKKGAALFGMDAVNDSLVQLEFDLVDAQRAIALASLAESVVRDGLTSEHLYQIARAQLLELEQIRWAGLAVQHKLSPAALAASIAGGEVILSAKALGGAGRGSGLASPHGIRQAFDLWSKQVDVAAMSLEARQQTLDELRPVGEMIRQLEESLS